MSIIVALDYTNPLEALEMAAKLRDHVDGFKINHALWSQSVYIKDYTDKELFIDCKLWDTPNTIKTVVEKIIAKGASMTTISTLNSPEVFEILKQYNNDIRLLGVTSLTSWTQQEEYDIHHKSPYHIWETHITKIKDNFAGIICPVPDLPIIDKIDPEYNLIRVCPGIKYETKLKGQSRTGTPKEAQELGADYVVIGRSITEASDPVEKVKEIYDSLHS
jgi:orotidine-5'-phosphate decarboxylase|tara:strand:- start:12737 stop:13393 length:657 start_codon:yes stop_codon:yes gene_type:complete